MAGIHVLTRIASRGGGGGGSGEAVTCDGGDSIGKVARWHTIAEDFIFNAGLAISFKIILAQSFITGQFWLNSSKIIVDLGSINQCDSSLSV